MNNIEKIRQEIERRIGSVNEKQDANPAMPKYRWHMYEGMKEAFIDMKYFIDTLPEEGFATVNWADDDWGDDGLRVHESTKSVHVSYRDVKDLRQRLEVVDTLPDENNPEPYNPVYDEDYLNEKIAKATKSWEGVDVDAMLAECRGYEEKPSEDLEEAADEHIRKVADAVRRRGWDWETQDIADAFIAGAEWQEKQDLRWAGEIHKNGYNLCKEQMMKDAMEIEVGMHGEPIQITLDKYVQRAKNIFPGEKVKILILKDEE